MVNQGEEMTTCAAHHTTTCKLRSNHVIQGTVLSPSTMCRKSTLLNVPASRRVSVERSSDNLRDGKRVHMRYVKDGIYFDDVSDFQIGLKKCPLEMMLSLRCSKYEFLFNFCNVISHEAFALHLTLVLGDNSIPL